MFFFSDNLRDRERAKKKLLVFITLVGGAPSVIRNKNESDNNCERWSPYTQNHIKFLLRARCTICIGLAVLRWRLLILQGRFACFFKWELGGDSMQTRTYRIHEFARVSRSIYCSPVVAFFFVHVIAHAEENENSHAQSPRSSLTPPQKPPSAIPTTLTYLANTHLATTPM